MYLITNRERISDMSFWTERADLMEKMEVIEEMMGKEALLNEILMGMSVDELRDNVKWISRHHDIKFQEEE